MIKLTRASRLATKGLFKRSVRTYNDRVVEYFENPPNVGSFKRKRKNVGTGIVGSIACGDQLKFQVEVNEAGYIQDAVFKAFGCGSAIASSAYATELVKGLHIEEASKINNEHISSYLKLPPVKRHCSLLAEEAISAALEDFKGKNQQVQEEA